MDWQNNGAVETRPEVGARKEAQRPLILVVDDEPAVRELLLAILRTDSTYDLLGAKDAQEARRVLASRPIDLVVADLVMPGEGGLELMDWCRRECSTTDWIILSGRGTFEDVVKALHLGAYEFIPKPLMGPEALLIPVRNVLERRRMGEERLRLLADLESQNQQLNRRVSQLEEACRLLCRQHETIDDDLRRAEKIQRALLPTTPPSLGNFAVDTVYRPSRTVGGDLYDVVRLDERHAAIYVSDAAGHGVSAAMLAVLLKHRINLTDEQHKLLPPRVVLSRVNRHIHSECRKPGLFVTLVYCLLDLETGVVTLASAGHPSLILLRAGGQQETIAATGPALGISPDAEYSQRTITMSRGDRLLLYTDGAFEGLHDNSPQEELAPLVAGLEGDGWERLHELLAELTKRRHGAAAEDDMTFLMLSMGQSSSSIDNGAHTEEVAPEPVSPPASGVYAGQLPDGRLALSVYGRGQWVHCVTLHDACLEEIHRGRGVLIDLTHCEHLDSTFLGTLLELVDRAEEAGVALAIQGVCAHVAALFSELGMDRVIARFASKQIILPREMKPLTAPAVDEEEHRRRMLMAHEALATLSEENQQEFAHLIAHLRNEIQRLDARRVTAESA